MSDLEERSREELLAMLGHMYRAMRLQGIAFVSDGAEFRFELRDSLDAAWAEAEAALPEGWLIGALDLELPGGRLVPHWVAEATLTEGGKWAGEFVRVDGTPVAHGGTSIEAMGPTPAAALRALAAALRER